MEPAPSHSSATKENIPFYAKAGSPQDPWDRGNEEIAVSLGAGGSSLGEVGGTGRWVSFVGACPFRVISTKFHVSTITKFCVNEERCPKQREMEPTTVLISKRSVHQAVSS